MKLKNLRKKEAELELEVKRLDDSGKKRRTDPAGDISGNKRDKSKAEHVYIHGERHGAEGINRSVKTVLENRNLNGIVDIVANLIRTDKKL